MPDPKIKRRRPPRFDLMGGPVCLDFINTLDDRFSKEPKELLKSYLDLARFAEDTGILSDHLTDSLMEKSMLSRDAAQRALESAIELREAMYQVFWAIVQRKPVPHRAMVMLNSYVQSAAQYMNLVPARGHFVWQFDSLGEPFKAPLWPVARSAAELLLSDQLQYVRACASKTCEWFFLDTSKSHRRRWCDMTKCGNRAKARSFYTRSKRAAK